MHAVLAATLGSEYRPSGTTGGWGQGSRRRTAKASLTEIACLVRQGAYAQRAPRASSPPPPLYAEHT